MIKVKICGLSTPETITAAIEAGTDFVGLVFYPPSPRHVDIDVAKYLASFIPPNVKKVGLFVDPTNQELEQILNNVQLDCVQLHGDETPERTQEIKDFSKCILIKAIPVEDSRDIEKSKKYQNIADWILFDKRGDILPGGNGKTFDWSILKEYDRHTPFMLAGGLTPENVSDAIEMISPDAVDVSSGVEDMTGVKNSDKIRSFLLSAKGA